MSFLNKFKTHYHIKNVDILIKEEKYDEFFEYLKKLNLGVWGIIVNRIVPDFGEEWESELSSVQLLHSQHQVHTESLKLAASILGNMNVRQVPMVAYEPVGIDNLRLFSRLIWS